MAKHKKKATRNRKASMSRENHGWEPVPAQKARAAADLEDAVSDPAGPKRKVSNIKKRTGKNKPRCKHEHWSPWGIVEEDRGYYVWHKARRYCYGCGREEFGRSFVWETDRRSVMDLCCPVHEYVTRTRYYGTNGSIKRETVECVYCGKRKD